MVSINLCSWNKSPLRILNETHPFQHTPQPQRRGRFSGPAAECKVMNVESVWEYSRGRRAPGGTCEWWGRPGRCPAGRSTAEVPPASPLCWVDTTAGHTTPHPQSRAQPQAKEPPRCYAGSSQQRRQDTISRTEDLHNCKACLLTSQLSFSMIPTFHMVGREHIEAPKYRQYGGWHEIGGNGFTFSKSRAGL